MNYSVALEKMKSFCAYRERSHLEVKQKLIKLKVYGNDADEIIITLIQENFLNEERYAKAYVSGKFRIKKWGKNKIIKGLKAQNISERCIKKGIEEIDENEYFNTIEYWIKREMKKHANKSDFDKKGATAKFLISKGFESSLVWDILK